MQTDYLFHGIKGFERFAYYCYRFDMASKEANRRYKIVLFYEKYGLAATLEAFDISRRTLYRYQSALKRSNNSIQALEPKSKAPKTKRRSSVPQEIPDLTPKRNFTSKAILPKLSYETFNSS